MLIPIKTPKDILVLPGASSVGVVDEDGVEVNPPAPAPLASID